MSARRLALALWLLTLAPLLAAASERIERIGAVGITVSDAERAAAFFADVLDFTRVSDVEVGGSEYERLQGVFPLRMRVVRMRLGQEEIELSQYLAPRGRPMPPDSRGNDLWFQHVAIVVSDMARAYARLRAAGVEHVSPGPQRLPDWNPAAGGIEAFYFRDPDGHFLELIRFPEGKGQPRWQRGGALFLGIDHSAITVADTATSVAFYRDRLGLALVGSSENHGTEQERLNGVFGARLRITTLRAAAGPGLELLEYLSPADGRPRPGDARANDLLHWQTDLVAGDLAALEREPELARTPWLSPGRVALAGGELGPREAWLIADPDGHVLRLRDAGGH
jgi:catechol 2,3-dioxygenase-like lactoylglutathione lyase family enzyme